MFNQNLDGLNDKPFLEYLDPTEAARLLKLKKRSAASFKKLQSCTQIQELFSLIGDREQYRINTGFNRDWVHKIKGWDEDSKFPTQSFRELDFFNILLGSYNRARTSIALSDQNLDLISNIRIDFDFDVFSAEKSIKLALEIEDKLANIGLPVFFFSTGNKGIQSCIPLPNQIPYQSALLLWTKLQNYLQTDLAKLDVCSVKSYLRIPLGRHSLTMLLSLFFDPHTGLYYSIDQQLYIYKKSLLWSLPENITDPLRDNSWEKFVADGCLDIPQKSFQNSISIEHKISDEYKPTANQNWSVIWENGKALNIGEFNAWLTHGLGMRSAYELYGYDAPEHLKKLAASIPGYETRFKNRCSRIDALWKMFTPGVRYQPISHSTTTLQMMRDNQQSQETVDKANRIFDFLKQNKSSTNRSINRSLLLFIGAVLHGIELSGGTVRISIDDLCSYINTQQGSISRRTLTRIIDVFTIDESTKIRTRNSKTLANPVAIFYRVKAVTTFIGSSPTGSSAAGFEIHKQFRSI